MKKILVVSWFFPPINSSEGLVTYKLLKNSKYSYDVFTQKQNTSWSYGNKEKLPECKNINTICGKSKDLNDWVNSAIAYFKENADKYDIVMTRSMPPESHKIGLEIKKIKPSVKWIASFGDPLAENPYTKISISYASPYALKNMQNITIRTIISPKRNFKSVLFNIRYHRLYKKTLQSDQKLQDKIIKQADYLIFNNKDQMEYMKPKNKMNYEEKGIVLFHSYDEELYPKKISYEKNEKIKMTYIGHLDNLRTPFLIFNAIRDLQEKDKNLDKKISFEFYGNLSDQDKLYLINNELTDIIHVRKPVTYLESLKIMEQSDWLIHVDANLFSIIEKNIFFAAKLSDYIGANKNIFAVTMQQGVSTEILHNINALTLSYSLEEIKNYIWLIIYEGYTKNIDQKYREKFNAIVVAKQFDNMLNKIM